MVSECAYRLSELVGRQKLLMEIQKEIDSALSGPQMIFLLGDGGIGKTRILLSLMERLEKYTLQREVIDFYDLSVHTATGFCGRVHRFLPQNGCDFGEYETTLDELKTMQRAGDAEISAQRKKVLSAFIECIKKCSKKNRIVLFLDTVEKLIYLLPNSTHELLFDVAEVREWLFASISEWGNVSLILAGRPEKTEILYEQAELIRGVSLKKIVVPGLDLEGTREYFDAVARNIEKVNSGDRSLIARIHGLNEEHKKKVFDCSGGRPIYLALLVDYMSDGEHPDKLLSNSGDIEELLIKHFVENPEIGDVLLAMGRAPKGVDINLLARILGITDQEAKEKIERICKYSFVKNTPRSDRWFLHDEMYFILQRQVYQSPFDAPVANYAQIEIDEYYEDYYQEIGEKLTEIFLPIEEGELLQDSEELDDLIVTRRQILLEILYYRLRENPIKGVERFYRDSCEAVTNNDISMHLRLQAEMSSFWQDYIATGLIEFSGEKKNFILGVLAVEKVRRLWVEQNSKEAVLEAQNLFQKWDQLFNEPYMVGVKASLQVWMALMKVYDKDENVRRQAEVETEKLLEKLKVFIDDNDTDLIIWHARCTLGYVYWLRGYLLRQKGHNQESLLNYNHAVRYWGEEQKGGVHLKTYLAMALNDMSFVLAEMGEISDAEEMAQRSLSLRRELGARIPVGLSLNTLGIIYRQQRYFQKAIAWSERALNLFQNIDFSRGLGLAYVALAESYRRSIMKMPSSAGEIEKINVLKIAQEYAENAYKIFENSTEIIRKVEALIEIGCACRDQVRLIKGSKNDLKIDVVSLISRGHDTLREASKLAGDLILYRNVDALVDLAWLGFHASDKEMMEDAIIEANNKIPEDYKISQNQSISTLQKKNLDLRSLWTQLGKLNVLRGENFIRTYHQDGKLIHLSAAGEAYALGLEYSRLYGEGYSGIEAGQKHIIGILEPLNSEELREICLAVRKFEANNDILGQSLLRKMLIRKSWWYEI